MLHDVPIWQEPLLPVDGLISPSERPGLGIELDQEAVARLRTR